MNDFFIIGTIDSLIEEFKEGEWKHRLEVY